VNSILFEDEDTRLKRPKRGVKYSDRTVNKIVTKVNIKTDFTYLFVRIVQHNEKKRDDCGEKIHIGNGDKYTDV